MSTPVCIVNGIRERRQQPYALVTPSSSLPLPLIVPPSYPLHSSTLLLALMVPPSYLLLLSAPPSDSTPKLPPYTVGRKLESVKTKR